MENYIAQKAEQALREMCSGGNWEERIQTAEIHFGFVQEEHFLSSCPPELQKEIQQVGLGESLEDRSRALQIEIEGVNMLWGKEQADGAA